MSQYLFFRKMQKSRTNKMNAFYYRMKRDFIYSLFS